MPVLALLRGANLGSKRFSPKAVEAALADLEVRSIGAAGTFVVGKRVAESTLRKRLADAMPFEPEVLVVAAKDVQAALAAGEALKAPDGARRFATALSKEPGRVALPLEAPEGKGWGVRVLAVEGRFALGVRRRVDETGVYPNEVIEKAFGVRATTRDWPTMEKAAKLLK
ncbi:MAG: hypothetical protein QOD77_1415 [Thermoplasmata archaeon]|jgi:uncharacterized protein (DUF1697 family)|nr:hypothetical protein [Thermoplasmata archaeon]